LYFETFRIISVLIPTDTDIQGCVLYTTV